MSAMKNPFAEERRSARRSALVRVKVGRTVATPGVLEAVPHAELFAALERHMRRDWGEVCKSDWETNNEALKTGERLLSVYKSAAGTEFWIITDADRAHTTFLLPSEY